MQEKAASQPRRRARFRIAVFLAAALTASASALAEPAIVPLPNAPDASALAQAQAQPAASTTAAASQPAAQSSGQAPKPGDSDYNLQKAEHQRILGIIPEFSAVNHAGQFEPLTPKQKFNLFWKSSTDPYIFALDAIVAGIGQAKNSNAGYGQGVQGYFKRYAASYADTFDGNFWGNAVLTSAFHEDPRYFREGEGHSSTHRALYSALTALWCRRDSGNWGPNYANVLGNIIAGGISNAYYPAADRGLSKTFTGAVTVTAEGTIGSELEEFWPDIENHFLAKRRSRPLPPAQP